MFIAPFYRPRDLKYYFETKIKYSTHKNTERRKMAITLKIQFVIEI